MKKILLYLGMLLLAQNAFSQTVTLDVFVAQDDAWSGPAVEGASVTISNADVLPAGATATTGADGIASFQIEQPTTGIQYDVEISKAGYATYIGLGANWMGIYVSEWTTFPYEQKMGLKMNYNVDFTVTDESDVAIQGATISMLDPYPNIEDKTTDASGQASFERNSTWSNQNYTVSADGYADTTNFFTIAANSGDQVIPVIKMKLAYPVTMTLVDGSAAPVEGAFVTLTGGGVTLEATSDAAGQLVFEKRVNGDYSYVITGTGFVDEYGSVTVADGDPNTTVTLTTGYDLTFTVINGETGDVGLEGDTITIDGQTKVTGADGIVTFGVLPGSSYTFDIVKAGFISVPVDVTDIQANTDITANMKPDYTVMFTISNTIDYTPVEGSTISFNSVDYVTGADGVITISNVEPSATSYDYTVTGPDGSGYKNYSGNVNLPLSSNSYKWDNNKKQVSVYLEKPAATIAITNGFMPFYSPATIIFDGVEYPYDANLYSTFYVEPGTYPVTIITEDTQYAIYSDSVTVTETENGWLSYSIVPGYTVDIYATDKNVDPIEGAEVIFNNDTVTTDASGLAQFIRVAGADHTYSITKDGYVDIVDAALTVATADVTEIATLNQAEYSITLTITDGTDAIEGATVTIGEATATSDASGIAVLSGMINGNYDYTVTATGYVDATGSVTVADADLAEAVTMSLQTYSVTFTVSDGTNAIDGATVTIGETTATADASGVAVITGLVNGAYDYTASAAGYVDATGSVTVADDDLAEAVSLSLIEYSLTFTVTDGTDAIEGATVTVGEATATTDASGVAAFDGLVNGDYSYTVTATDYDDASGSVTVADGNADEAVTLILTVGIEELNGIEFSAYPNPTNGLVYVTINNAEAISYSVKVTNMLGSVIEQMEVYEGTEKVRIDLSGYADGMYILYVSSDDSTSLQKIMKN